MQMWKRKYLLIFFQFLIFRANSQVKGQKCFKMTENRVESPISQEAYTPYGRDFWYTYIKWWHLHMLCLFFQNFDFLGCYGGKKAKKWPKRTKRMSVSLYLKNHTSYVRGFWYTYVKWYLQQFFHFFKFWFLGFLAGWGMAVKRLKADT